MQLLQQEFTKIRTGTIWSTLRMVLQILRVRNEEVTVNQYYWVNLHYAQLKLREH